MNYQAKNQVYRLMSFLACAGALVTASGCMTPSSCQVASYVHSNPEFSQTLEKLRRVSTLEEAQAICFKKLDWTRIGDDGQEEKLPIEVGLNLFAEDTAGATEVFAEMTRFAGGSKVRLSERALKVEHFVHPNNPMSEDEMRREALFRLPLYKLYPQIKEGTSAIKEFCQQTQLLSSGKAEGVEGVRRLKVLRQKAVGKIEEARLLFSTPAVAKATVAACQERGTGETLTVNPGASVERRGQVAHAEPLLLPLPPLPLPPLPAAGAEAAGAAAAAEANPSCNGTSHNTECSL